MWQPLLLDLLGWLFFPLYYALIVAISVYILLEKRSPTRTIAWILSLIFLPGVGLLLWLFFGRNLRRKKKRYLKRLRHHARALEGAITPSSGTLPKKGGAHKRLWHTSFSIEKLESLLVQSGATPAYEHTQIRILVAGAQKFPALFSALETAQSYIFLEYYILDERIIGKRLLAALSEKVRQGVEVRLIVDDIGSWNLSRKFVRSLKRAGIELRKFMPVFSVYFADRANYRNHRKIVVIDGRIGFTGGMNLSDAYLLQENELESWRDIHLQLKGRAVRELERIFLKDWAMVADSGRALHAPPPPTKRKYKAKESKHGGCRVQIVAGGPFSEWPQIQMAFFTAINLAQKQILIATPYFLPDESILMALTTAAMRGVDVKILLPLKSDSWFLDLGNHSFVEELLLAGTEIRFFAPGFNHSKLMIIDATFASIGSANMDHRSFEQNFEVQALIYDASQAKKLRRIFFRDWEQSIKANPSSKGFFQRMLESLARMVAPLL